MGLDYQISNSEILERFCYFLTSNTFFSRYFEFEVLTPGPMRVGWARIDCDPGFQIGSDENSWAFDGFNVS